MISSSLTRAEYAAATDLIARYGADARGEALTRANESRDRGNVVRFCTWRQVERLIAVMMRQDVTGTVH